MDFYEFCKQQTLEIMNECGLTQADVKHQPKWKSLKVRLSAIKESEQTYKEKLEKSRKWCKDCRYFLVKLKHDKRRYR